MSGVRGLLIGGAVAAIMAASPAFAEEIPNAGRQDSRIRYINFDTDEVVRINGVFRAASQIVFGEGETISSVALGDTVSWEVAPADNILFIKPREKAPATNLIVVTKRGGTVRTYTFALTARSGAISTGTDAQFVVRFRYPAEEAAAARQAQLQQVQMQMLMVEAGGVKVALEAAAVQGRRNLDYSIAGSSDLAPSEITDNGQFTIMRFPRNQQLPAIFTVLPDGSEAVVPYDVRGEFVVVHQVSRQLRLRRGQSLTCIWNNAYDRYGPDNSSGTASPDVERSVEGSSPR
ncbi:P-type conjugative transfer protein VirB9 (plasmid) [Sphingobium yanoikuyae]|jgi:type IV secretion system protein VirB9|uniref:P-type conjugative transfer protein VirB9 n=1 Tax=Sphingobium yanoikuyae TaxID=13690 RepID=A0A6P1GQH4_SPHYA|nr:P-type conjugative transfer protein VirB9 [Sphingobium yanoikuyae]QHD70847.1 P-type conjugative transfer protein VirB9 [Sphingobium yanoikuyae]SCW93524.1 type IV secretion system protein VirB9 [Sphingobium faniae]